MLLKRRTALTAKDFSTNDFTWVDAAALIDGTAHRNPFLTLKTVSILHFFSTKFGGIFKTIL